MGSDQGAKARPFGAVGRLLGQRRPLLFFAVALACLLLGALLLPLPPPLSYQDNKDDNRGSTRTLLPVSSFMDRQQQQLPRVVVLVTPSPVPNPGTRHDRLLALMESWGRRQPQHLAVLIPTDDPAGDSGAALQAVNASAAALPSDLFLELPAVYGPTDNVGRIQWSLQEASHRVPDAEWFMVLNEHTFVVPENLLCFLRDHSHSHTDNQPLFLGHRLTLEDGTAFHSGGAGFLLNRAARDRLLQGLEDGSPQACLAPNEWAKTNAGVTLARCLAALGVEATSTRGFDNLERFHVYGPCRTAEGDVDDWFVQYHPGDGVAGAAGCCVPETVSWHYVGPMEARALASVLYGGKGRARLLAAKQSNDSKGRSKAKATNWPIKGEDLGGYARVPSDDSPTWDLLADGMRVCAL